MDQFTLTFALDKKTIFDESIIKKFNKNFSCDFSEKNLNNIFLKMIKADGTLSRKLKRGEDFEWKIEADGISFQSRRFSNLLPYIFMDKRLDNKLYAFQKEGINWLLKKKNRILADDMGLGKTLQTIAAFKNLIFTEKHNLIVIFSPKSLSLNWLFEIKKWTPLIQAQLFKDILNKKNLIDIISNSLNVLIVSYSEADKFNDLVKKQNVSIDLLVADEAHKLRKDSSKVNNLIKRMKRDNTWLLSGTPLERDSRDIKNILTILNPSKEKGINELQDLLLRSNLEQNSLRRLKSDVLNDLPKTSRSVIMLEMTSDQKNLYKKTLKIMGNASGKDRISFFSKLVQIAAGDKIINSSKYERAIEIIENCILKKEKVIVFSNFNDVLKTFQKKLNSLNISSLLFTGELDSSSRDQVLTKFKKDPMINVLNLNSHIGSEGLTLVEASNVIFLNEWWNPSSNRQAEDRVNRIGQKKIVNFYILRSFETIDENIGLILENKKLLEKNFIEELSENFNNHKLNE